jgi:hypothetical protein
MKGRRRGREYASSWVLGFSDLRAGRWTRLSRPALGSPGLLPLGVPETAFEDTSRIRSRRD